MKQIIDRKIDEKSLFSQAFLILKPVLPSVVCRWLYENHNKIKKEKTMWMTKRDGRNRTGRKMDRKDLEPRFGEFRGNFESVFFFAIFFRKS